MHILFHRRSEWLRVSGYCEVSLQLSCSLALLCLHWEYNRDREKKMWNTIKIIWDLYSTIHTQYSTTLQFGWWQLAGNWNIDYSLLFSYQFPSVFVRVSFSFLSLILFLFFWLFSSNSSSVVRSFGFIYSTVFNFLQVLHLVVPFHLSADSFSLPIAALCRNSECLNEPRE